MLRAALLLMVVVCIGWPSQHALAQQKEQRVALVIGNSSYKTEPLRNPVNDAEDIAKALWELKFKVTLKTNLISQYLSNDHNPPRHVGLPSLLSSRKTTT